ncbi:MAG: sialidase family protein [Planctomycetota bacterium]
MFRILKPIEWSSFLCFIVIASIASAQSQVLEGKLEAYLGEPQMELQQVFNSQRFPNVVVTLKGTVLASFGNKGVQIRRSDDGGKSWKEPILIDKDGFQGGGMTVDETNGDILAFIEASHPPAPLTLYRSRDDGKTWVAETTEVKPDSQGNIPSMHMNEHGITLRHGKHKGRLLRPTRWYAGKNERGRWPDHYTNAMYSDDEGKTWQTSEPFPENGTGEATLAELSDGTIYYNTRIHWDKRPNNTRRRSALSKDGGQTWVDWDIVEILPDGHQHRSYGCMGGLTRLAVAEQDILIFSNLDTPNATRERGTVWASFDGGATWPVKRLVFDGPSGYSSMSSGRPDTASEGWIYLHFEGGPKGGSTLARMNLAWILAGEKTGDGELPSFN